MVFSRTAILILTPTKLKLFAACNDGTNPSRVLDRDSKLDSVILAPTEFETNPAQAQLDEPLGLTYTARATVSSPVSGKTKVYTVRLPTRALLLSRDTSLDDLIDKHSLMNDYPSKRHFANDSEFEREELELNRWVCPSPMPSGLGDSQTGYKLLANSVLFKADDHLPQHPAVREPEWHTISSQDLQTNEAWYCNVPPEDEWILYGLGGKRGTCI